MQLPYNSPGDYLVHVLFSQSVYFPINGPGRPSGKPRYFAFGVSLHWSSISSICTCEGALSTTTANGVLLLNHWNLFFCASKSANRPLKSAPSRLSFSANSAEHGGRDLLCHVLLQQGKWLKFLCRLCVSHRLSLVLKTRAVVYMSEIMPFPTLQLQVH